MDVDLAQVLSQAIAFLVFLWVLKRYAWIPLLEILEERRRKIQSEFDTIAQQKGELQNVADDYRKKLEGLDAEARHRMNEAVSQGRLLAKEIHDETQREAKEMIKRAKDEITKEIEEARHELRDEMVTISINAAQKILEENLNDARHKKLVENFLEKAKL